MSETTPFDEGSVLIAGSIVLVALVICFAACVMLLECITKAILLVFSQRSPAPDHEVETNTISEKVADVPSSPAFEEAKPLERVLSSRGQIVRMPVHIDYSTTGSLSDSSE